MTEIDTLAGWIMGLPDVLEQPTTVVTGSQATAHIIMLAMSRFQISLPLTSTPPPDRSTLSLSVPVTGRYVCAPDVDHDGGLGVVTGAVSQGRAILDDVWRTGVDIPVLSRTPRSVLATTSRLLPGRALADVTGYGLGSVIASLLSSADQDVPRVVQHYCRRLFYSWPQVRGRVDAVVAGPSRQPWLAACLAAGIAGLVDAPYVGRIRGESGDREEDFSRMIREIRLDPAKLKIPAISGKKVLVVGTEWESGLLLTMAGQALKSAGAGSVVPFSLGTRSSVPRRQSWSQK